MFGDFSLINFFEIINGFFLFYVPTDKFPLCTFIVPIDLIITDDIKSMLNR